ncbi:MAG: hypothetical protein D6781_06845 [Verrucomicrobia bacterium]|nr:MAG: hypothetical protein D6781_06845 [Verrucomicrobiota bacterium]
MLGALVAALRRGAKISDRQRRPKDEPQHSRKERGSAAEASAEPDGGDQPPASPVPRRIGSILDTYA